MRQSSNSEFHEFTASAGGSASSGPCRGGDRKGEARTDPRTANSERCFWMSLSRGGGSLVHCHGGSATDCTVPPCWSQIVYTSRSSCDLRRCPAPDRGNPPHIPGVPPQTTACNRSPRLRPPGEPARPQAREGGGPWHLPWERPGPLTEALARSERAAGRRTLPRPAARFMSGPPTGTPRAILHRWT